MIKAVFIILLALLGALLGLLELYSDATDERGDDNVQD